MLRKIAIALASLLGLIVGMALIGWMLPQGHQASRTGEFAAPPDRIFGIISDVSKYPEWRPDVTRVDVLPDDGRGLRFREHGSNGAIVFRIEYSEPPRTLRVRIDDPDQPFVGLWTYKLTLQSDRTSVTITEDGEVANPIFRFLSRVVFSQTATIDAYLAALQRRLAG